MNLIWDKHYPDAKFLKNEIKYMIDAYLEIIFQNIPGEEIDGIYLKGSAQKKWESPLDYVPELSDVDIHLLFSNDSSVTKYFGSPAKALDILEAVEKNFFSKIPNPIHIPRPQLMILNLLLKEKDFFPSPRGAITVLYGKDYPKPDFGNPAQIRRSDCEKVLERGTIIPGFPLQVVDKPSKYLWSALRQLSWRVSPIGPSVLNISGIDPEKSWSLNRTRVVKELEDLGRDKLAKTYAAFYLNGWTYFLSNYSDTDAGRAALLSGVEAISIGVAIAKSKLSEFNSG